MEDRTGLIVPGGADQRTHKQRMLDGDPFFGPDPELLTDAVHASALVAGYAAAVATDPAAAAAILRRLFRRFDGIIRLPFTVEFGYQTSIGEGSFINSGATLVDNAPITIGDRVLIAPNAQIVTSYHPLDRDERRTAVVMAKPIAIHDDAWLGIGVVVLPGVTIGEAAVVGAGSVVTKNVPPWSVVVGNPARVIRNLDPRSGRA